MEVTSIKVSMDELMSRKIKDIMADIRAESDYTEEVYQAIENSLRKTKKAMKKTIRDAIERDLCSCGCGCGYDFKE